MDKPIMVRKQELAEKIANAINDSRLHLCIVQPMIEKLSNQMLEQLQTEYMKEKEEYEKSLKEEADEDINSD